MPATTAQVFGPNTVDPGFTTTGEKTLLTMSTSLPAGGKNVIIVVFGKNNAFSTFARGTYRIYKGTTLLYESRFDEYFNYGGQLSKPVLLIAVDGAPAGNDSYSFRINITASGTATGSVHVQGIVIKTDDASWAYNTTAVSIAAGATATVTSLTTAFPANSKVALVAVVYGSWSGGGHQLIGAGNIKLKAGTTVVASNQFNVGSYQTFEPLWVSLAYLDTPTSGSQTYSVEVTNGSGQTFNFYAEIVAFTVSNGAFLDTNSVGLSNGSQTTVGSLTTSLSGDVVVIGLAAAENTAVSNVTAFYAGDVVLQLNNSSTGQISNLVGWYTEASTYHGRSGVLPLFRLDTGITNPSYQIKMTARAGVINGEAKILAFSVAIIVAVSDGGVGVDSVSVSVSVPVLDTGAGVDAASLTSSVPVGDVGSSVEVTDLSVVVPVGDVGTGVEFVASGTYQPVVDTGSGMDEMVMLLREILDTGIGTELVDMVKGVLDDGVGTDIINSPEFKQLFETGLGVDTPMIVLPQFDAGIGIDTINMVKEVLDVGMGVEEIPFLGREVLDTGGGVDIISLVTSVISHDFGVGTDVVGLVSVVQVIDTGVGAELAETQLSIYGVVTLDNNVIVGVHSIPYRDLARDGLPIQTQRRFVDDRVYVGGVEVGVVTVEWEDKVADIVPGVRTVRVAGVVRLVE